MVIKLDCFLSRHVTAVKLLLALAVVCLTRLAVFSQAPTPSYSYNFDFEQTSRGKKLPEQWSFFGSGYKVSIDTVIRNKGKNAVLIEPVTNTTAKTVGGIMYAIPATFEAKEIEVKAVMKTHNVNGGPIGLMVRLDGPSGVVGFENMKKKNIQGTIDWTVFSVKIPYVESARTINIGAMLWGSGQLWIDDFDVLLDGKDIREAKVKPPKIYKAIEDHEFDNGSGISRITLQGSTIEHLDVLGKVWGFLKYYHPQVTSGKYQWDYELFRILPKILAVKNQKERNAVLDKWISNLGGFESGGNEIRSGEEIKLMPDFSWIDEKTLGKYLTATLNKIRQAKRTEDSYYFPSPSSTGPHVFLNEKPYPTFHYADAGFKLLALYRYWNIIQYHFPYKYLIEEDWNKVLREYIPQCILAKDGMEYRLTLLSLIARIRDTHANIRNDIALFEHQGRKFAPLQLAFVEGRAIVTSYFDKSLGEKSGIKIGDIIETVDGKKVDHMVKERLSLTPASNYPTQLRDIARNLLRTNKAQLKIEYSTGTESLSTSLETFYPYFFRNYEMRPKIVDTCFLKVAPEIAYLYPGTIKNDYLPRIMEAVHKAKGLIIDFRCYPAENITFSLGAYLLPESKPFVKFSRNSITTPGLFTLSEATDVGQNNPDYYRGKIVIIINEFTQSQAEFSTMAFRAAPGATVIGSTTAAADGDISKIMLPGGIETVISGFGIYYPDGRETQRVGIIPDVEVKPTIQGIREGRDELLEKAIEIIGMH